MSKNPKRGEPFVMLPQHLLESEAWRSLSINARRFLDFLMLEHMRHSGQENGSLLAPRRQLEQHGIGARHISAAIEETKLLGLVDCKRGTGRRPSVYALTWLPLSCAGTAPSSRWQARSDFPREVTYDFRREVTKAVATSEGKSQGLKTRVSEGKSPSRKSSYQEGDSPKLKVGGRKGRSVGVVSNVFPTGASVRAQILVSPTPKCASHGP